MMTRPPVAELLDRLARRRVLDDAAEAALGLLVPVLAGRRTPDVVLARYRVIRALDAAIPMASDAELADLIGSTRNVARAARGKRRREA